MAILGSCPSLFLFLGLLHTALCASLQSVPELEIAMYQFVDGSPCVRLLNISGEIGCANPGRTKVVAPIARLLDLNYSPNQKTAVLLPPSSMISFLNRTLNDPSFAVQIAGLLVEYDPDFVNSSKTMSGISDDQKFPQSEFAPYDNKSYSWNPSGSGIIQQRYNFPIFLLSDEDTKTLQEVAAENQKRNLKHPVKVAEFDLVMQTTKSGTHTSNSCLQERSCLPLGGYSVWSSLPPINTSSTSEQPIVLVISSMDSASFFRDKTPGADSPLSGMIALLAAVDALSKISIDKWKKQLAFAVFTGEAWGYLGSRRFLAELDGGETSVQGLNSSLIHQILEVGSVGRAAIDETIAFYAHRQNNKTSAIQEIWNAIYLATTSLNVSNAKHIQMTLASESNPGIPPSSLWSFLHKNSSVAGMVLSEFDTAFKNQVYHSRFDDARNLNVSSIVAAASVVARTLYILVNDDTDVTTMVLESIVANSTLVEELAGCLLTCTPGMDCSLVKSLITPTQTCANHYVGVFLGGPSANPSPGTVDDTSRFVWNFLASRTASGNTHLNGSNKGVECSAKCDNPGEVCVGSTIEHKGVCVLSTTRYVPAYSTRLQHDSSGWNVVPAEPHDKMSQVDPIYTESFWKTLTVRVYTKESSFYDILVLLIGIAVTIASSLVALGTKTVYRKRLKWA